MSDDDRDIDIESDDDIDSDTCVLPQRPNTQNFTQEERRAHHNALERKRRDHIKESFSNLRETVPTLKGEKASRAQILKKTTECIQSMRNQIDANQKDVNDLKHQISVLEEEIRLMENARSGYDIDPSGYQQLLSNDFMLQNVHFADDENDNDDDGDVHFNSRCKRMKTSFNDT